MCFFLIFKVVSFVEDCGVLVFRIKMWFVRLCIIVVIFEYVILCWKRVNLILIVEIEEVMNLDIESLEIYIFDNWIMWSMRGYWCFYISWILLNFVSVCSVMYLKLNLVGFLYRLLGGLECVWLMEVFFFMFLKLYLNNCMLCFILGG